MNHASSERSMVSITNYVRLKCFV